MPQLTKDTIKLDDEVVFPNDAVTFLSNTYVHKLQAIAQKKQIRKSILDKRDALPRKARQQLSNSICRQLWELIISNNSRVIHSYLPMGSEVNVAPLLQKALDFGLQVVVPKTLKKRQMQNLVLKDLGDMEPGIFNTYHPRNAEEYNGNYDLIIVAGLAFDSRGFRVGYGGGYYDTFLASQTDAFKAGVCYPFQMIDQVPIEEHDIRLDCVLAD
ncbi:MAG: 5-formyltetrahydrofolate cyclo-ligase [Flavobacteriales bacterium]